MTEKSVLSYPNIHSIEEVVEAISNIVVAGAGSVGGKDVFTTTKLSRFISRETLKIMLEHIYMGQPLLRKPGVIINETNDSITIKYIDGSTKTFTCLKDEE